MLNQPAEIRFSERAVTIYSPMFNDARVPRHVRLDQHTTALYILEWLNDAIKIGSAEVVEPDNNQDLD